MEKSAKLKTKLANRSVTARELRALLLLEGWLLERTRGSHEFWVNGPKTFVLAVHGKDLKLYQIKQASQLLLTEED